MAISVLPNEILVGIFVCFTRTQDLVNCSQVCIRWHSCLLSMEERIRSIVEQHVFKGRWQSKNWLFSLNQYCSVEHSIYLDTSGSMGQNEENHKLCLDGCKKAQQVMHHCLSHSSRVSFLTFGQKVSRPIEIQDNSQVNEVLKNIQCNGKSKLNFLADILKNNYFEFSPTHSNFFPLRRLYIITDFKFSAAQKFVFFGSLDLVDGLAETRKNLNIVFVQVGGKDQTPETYAFKDHLKTLIRIEEFGMKVPNSSFPVMSLIGDEADLEPPPKKRQKTRKD